MEWGKAEEEEEEDRINLTSAVVTHHLGPPVIHRAKEKRL